MPRTPPNASGRRAARGPVQTKHLPDRSDAKRTWSGPPTDRTPGRWSGTMDHGGKKHHVGTFDTPRKWGEARDKLLVTLREQAASGASRPAGASELEGVTLRQFVDPDGRYRWPWNFTRGGKRSVPETFAHHAQCIKPFVAAFGDRPIKSLGWFEAEQWAQGATENQVTSAKAMLNDACHADRTFASPLGEYSRQRTRGRKDLPNVLSIAEIQELRRLALWIHNDGWGPVLEAMIEVEATSALRPGELWALERPRFNLDTKEIFIENAVKKGGKLGPPKFNQRRWCVVAPTALQLILALDVIDPRWVFPAKQGGLIYSSLWTAYWHPVREAFTAGLPANHWLPLRIASCAERRLREPDPLKRKAMPTGKLDFYELRHRGITFMGTPAPHGLGLRSPDIAYQVGHRDGGRLIEELYMHRDPELARERIRTAMGYSTDGPSSEIDAEEA